MNKVNTLNLMVTEMNPDPIVEQLAYNVTTYLIPNYN